MPESDNFTVQKHRIYSSSFESVSSCTIVFYFNTEQQHPFDNSNMSTTVLIVAVTILLHTINAMVIPDHLVSRRSIIKDIDAGPLDGEHISKRAAPTSGEIVVAEAPENAEPDMETAANTIIFKPLFRSQQDTAKYGRVLRSVAQQSDKDEKEAEKSAINAESMETAANTIVFRPIFRSQSRSAAYLRGGRQRRQIAKRSAAPGDTQNTVNGESDLETAADIVFRPLFRRRTNQERILRY